MTERRWIFVFALTCATLGALILAAQTWARPPVPAPVFKAVRTYWKAPADRVEAFDVIACETGNTYSTRAQNGQYLGLFQMGSFARARFGHGASTRHRYEPRPV